MTTQSPSGYHYRLLTSRSEIQSVGQKLYRNSFFIDSSTTYLIHCFHYWPPLMLSIVVIYQCLLNYSGQSVKIKYLQQTATESLCGYLPLLHQCTEWGSRVPQCGSQTLRPRRGCWSCSRHCRMRDSCLHGMSGRHERCSHRRGRATTELSPGCHLQLSLPSEAPIEHREDSLLSALSVITVQDQLQIVVDIECLHSVDVF